jgi:hypothetical protein
MKFLYENEILILVAEEGYKLTDGSCYVSRVNLGVEASISDWNEILETDIPQEEDE